MQLQPHQKKRIRTKLIAAIKFDNLKDSVNKQLPTPEKKPKQIHYLPISARKIHTKHSKQTQTQKENIFK